MGSSLRAACISIGIVLTIALPKAQTPGKGPQTPGRITFTDVAAAVGLAIPKVQVNVVKDFLIDTTGSGVAFFDYDQDRDLDIVIVNTSSVERLPGRGEPEVQRNPHKAHHFTE